MNQTQFAFKNKDIHELPDFNVWFTPLARLLNRLLTHHYSGNEIKIIGIAFFELIPPNTESFLYIKFDKALICNNVIDYSKVYLSDNCNKIIWEKVYQVLKNAILHYNFPGFEEALDKAYSQGLSMNLSLDYVYKEKIVYFNEEAYKAIVYIKFTENIDELTVLFRVEKDDKILVEESIMKGRRNEAIFLYAIKNISFDQKGNIVIKGMNNVTNINFPIRIKVIQELNS